MAGESLVQASLALLALADSAVYQRSGSLSLYGMPSMDALPMRMIKGDDA